jgi:hypothetical protein
MYGTPLQTAVSSSSRNVLTQCSPSHLHTVYVTTFNIRVDGTSFSELEGGTSSASSNPMCIKLGSPGRDVHVCVENGQSEDLETESKNDTSQHSSEQTPFIYYLTQVLSYSIVLHAYNLQRYITHALLTGILLLLLLFLINFMHITYNYITETNHVSRIYSHAPHNNILVNDGQQIRRWSQKVIIL